MWIVQIALRRPYTFVVLSLLIALFGIRAALFTPTDIFPNINIPVISVVWTYNGLPPSDMSGRVIYYYERTLTAQVGDIEHIESQSLSGYGVVKIFFQKEVDIAAAMAQVTAASQTVLKLLPPGITPPYVLSYNASSVPILQLALSSKALPQMKLFDLGQNFIRPQLATVQGAAVPSPYGGKILQVQVDLDQQAMQSHNVSAEDIVNAVSAQNLILPAGDQKIGKFDWNVALNASPTVLDKINDLPVKKINGTIIYVHDVAFVHQGSPPQTNVVRVNGARAVLMTILKAGSASTLDIIDGIKSLLPRVQQSLPSSLNLRAVGDQSVFVKAAVFGVIREAVLAAALVGVMILLFLGSWRSTVIILTEIPLAVLFALTALSAIGETINVMTLGGLALAVGILVDDGTVTIENVNYHLEQGKQIEPAILDGAQQIVVPAFVTLLCLCIVFVPMFQLGGVAGYLFRPMAEAVVFALIGSFILSRTLVPTMANFLMHGHHSTESHVGEMPPPPTRNPLLRFQQGFEARFEKLRGHYRSLLTGALARPKTFMAAFLACVVLSFGLAPFLGENFFPSVDSGQILMHVRAQPGTRIEETARLLDQIEQTVRDTIPPGQLDNIVDNIGLPISGINMAYRAPARSARGWRHPDLAEARITTRPTATSRRCARCCRRNSRERPSRFLPADIVIADPQFRPAGADRRAGHRPQPDGQLRLCQRSSEAHPAGARHRRPAHPAGVQLSADQCRRRPHPGRRGRADPARRRQQPARHAVGQRPGAAHLLAQRRKRRLLSDRRPDAAIPGQQHLRPVQHPGHGARHRLTAISGRARAHHAGTEPRRRLALQCAAGDRHLCRYPGARSRRRLRRYREDRQATPRSDLPRGSDRRGARPGPDHGHRLQRSSISAWPAPSC